MVIKEEYFCIIFEIVRPWNFFTDVDLQCPLISGRNTGRELTMATPQRVIDLRWNLPDC